MAGVVGPIANDRRHHLAVLAYEASARGFDCRLTGPGSTILRVTDPATGLGVMVAAVPTSPTTWCYLWTGGGAADTADTVRAVDLLAGTLRRR
jgi:hypothetical protein